MTPQDRHTAIDSYRAKVISAANETVRKELFKNLLIKLYGDDVEASRTIDEMALGAERVVAKIPLKDRIKTGFADTQYGRTIIEFEFDLKKTGEHAREQLAEYLSGNWQSGDTAPFTLIATDCLAWVLYTPDYEQLQAGIATASDLKLKEIERFVLTDRTLDDFYFFLDRVLFRREQVAPTLDRIKRDFGESSSTFIQAFRLLLEHLDNVKERSDISVAYEQWERFLSIAYGEFKGEYSSFALHTYLSIFAKIIAYEVLTHDEFIDEDELRGILNGNVFQRLHVNNFVERDFFGWVAHDQHFNALKPAFRIIAREIGRYDFSVVREDVLKGVYQELIDLDTRHALGEYYTPDWLCERVVAELNPKPGQTTLDPACGSGSFLRALIAHLRTVAPEMGAAELLRSVSGIDIHPLSVQISKTTLLLAIGPDLLRRERRPVTLPVYLANTLLVPKDSTSLFGQTYTVHVDDERIELPQSAFDSGAGFDEAVEACDRVAEDDGDLVTTRALGNVLHRSTNGVVSEPGLVDGYYALYQQFRRCKQQGRDSIWSFIVRNTYRPFLLKHKFDFVVGNPPWLTYADFGSLEHQEQLKELARQYHVVPAKRVKGIEIPDPANMPHLEIAAIFIAHAANHFLKSTGTLAFVLPRSFFSGDQHKNLRAGAVNKFRLTGVWDLDGVGNLFRVPACVLFGEPAPTNVKKAIPERGLPGFDVQGDIQEHNCTWLEATPQLIFEKAKWYLGELGTRTALTRHPLKKGGVNSVYKNAFRQGATIVPRNFYFVEPEGEMPPDLIDREILLRTDQEQQQDAKEPWKKLTLQGRVHTDFLYRTVIARNILPFTLFGSMLVALPLRRREEGRIEMMTPDQIRNSGHLATSQWFREAARLWEEHRTGSNAKVPAEEYLDWQQKLTQQNFKARWLVLYNSSAKDANAVVVQPGAFDLPFVVDHKAYWLSAETAEEAHYLAACLNADEPNRIIKDFQSRGLFGARDVHKSILDVPFPRYNAQEEKHRALSDLGMCCAERAWEYVVPVLERGKRISGPRLGVLRLEVRAHLAIELGEIDRVLRNILEG